MSEPYWEPLGGLGTQGPAGPQGPQGPAYTLPGRLHASAVAGNGNVSDPNLCVENGWYSVYVPSGAGMPPGVNHAHIWVGGYDSSYLIQHCYYLYGDTIWTRRRVNGTWGNWLLRTPIAGVFSTGALSNDTQYGWNVWFPIIFPTVPVVFVTRDTWINNLDFNGPYARDITTDHFDLHIHNYVQGNGFTIRWMAFNQGT